MRILVGASLLVGCGPAAEPLMVEHRSSLSERVSGLALSGDGSVGHAGMYGTTCDFATSTAVLDTDFDFPGTDEQVQDSTDDPSIGFVTLTVSHVGIHLTAPGDGEVADLSTGRGEPVHSRLVDGAAIVLVSDRGDCVARWIPLDGGGPSTTIALPPEACDPLADVTVDRDARKLYVAAGSVISVTEDGWGSLDVPADLVAWDPWADALYWARRGALEVSAVEADGAPRWAVEVPGRVQDLQHLGEQAAAAVSVAGEDEAGRLLVLDGSSGAERLDEVTPSAADSIATATGGGLLGLAVGDAVHFYAILVP